MRNPLEIRGLVKAYDGRNAVDGIDLAIHHGEVFALLGPNGAGKSTTVEVLEGFRTRDAGDVQVLGEDPQHAGRGWRNRIGMVLQTSTGLDLITPREALKSTAKVYSNPRNVDDVIDAVGLTEKAKDRIGKLSGGQRRRLDVALGIVGAPELLFLDEPTTGFDPQARRDFWELISGLADGGTTILLTTHYLDEAQQLADRVGVIASGRMLALDTPANLGGRSAQLSTVTWQDANGATQVERTSTPTQFVTALAASTSGEIAGLTVTRPSLEDTYLSLIGPHVADIDSSEPAEPRAPEPQTPEPQTAKQTVHKEVPA